MVSSRVRRPAWLVALYASAAFASTGVLLAFMSGSVHIIIVATLLMLPILLVASSLYVVELISRRAATVAHS